VRPDNSYYFHLKERFDSYWEWTESWSTVVVRKTNQPRWRWWNWIAEILREELKVDFVLLEDPIALPGALNNKDITLRELYNSCNNLFLIKAKVQGRHLRSYLISKLSPSDSGEGIDQQNTAIVIRGLKNPDSSWNGTAGISMKAIKDTQTYTILASDMTLEQGLRMKSKYTIEESGFMMPLLKKCFSHRSQGSSEKLLSIVSNSAY